MPKRSKRFNAALESFDKTQSYSVAEAAGLVKKTSSAKFDETVELHIRLGVDGRHADQQVRGAIVLPNGTGKSKKVLVFAKGPKAQEAQQFSLTAQVRPRRFWYLQRDLRLKRQRLLVQIT